MQSQNDTLRSGNKEMINAKYIELENRLFEAERNGQSLQSQVEQEKGKNKKLVNDFEQMVSVIKEGDADKKAINDNSLQAMVVKN